MRLRLSALALATLAAGLASCSADAPTSPPVAALGIRVAASTVLPGVRFSEIHYDNAGTDVGEAIEISGPIGTSIEGWQILLYNGANGQLYNTRTLSGSIPAVCSADGATRGVVVATYPTNGIQNGDPDGFALLDQNGTLIEFLSYGGVFTATNGPIAGAASHDILVRESGTTPIGFSLQRNGDGTWNAPAAATFGDCNATDTNDDGVEPPSITRVAVTPSEATVLIGAGAVLTARAFDEAEAEVSAAFAWASRDGDIATVVNGTVTGVAEGSTYIVATAAGLSDSALVTVEAPPPVVLPPVRFSEIHYDNAGTDVGEAIEVEGPAGTSVDGWRIVLYNGNGGAEYGSYALSGSFPNQCDGRGTLFLEIPGIQNGSPDGMALVDAADAVVEFLSYEGTFTATNGPAAGLLSVDIGAVQDGSNPSGTSLQRDAQGVWSSAPRGFGVCTGQEPPPPPNTVTIFGRSSSEPDLPVGFEDDFGATLRDGRTNAVIPTTFVWSTDTPDLVTVDQEGITQALAVGTATIRAVAEDGTVGTFTFRTQAATPSPTAQYANHVEFGTPTDSDASDDIIIARREFVSSWNPVRGIPNWVAYNLEQTHFGSQDRCDCFTFDPLVTASPRYTTADYTNGGFDRGHLARSGDRTAAIGDNAASFYLTNIIPQAPDNNQGPWARFEEYLAGFAVTGVQEVFIYAGAHGNAGSVKNEGKITIPEFTWKVAVIVPRNTGLADIRSRNDLEVVAVIMPNVQGIRNVNWREFEVTVDEVEALTGYDLLSLLRDDIEIAVESRTVPPVAATDGPYAAFAGDPVAMSAAGSTDLDGDALTFAWDFGDGRRAEGVAVAPVYEAPGTYTVTLVATDVRGLADTITTTATITALPPALAIARARALEAALLEAAALSRGEFNALSATLTAAEASLGRGNLASARGQLGAHLNQLQALVQSGRLPRELADPIVNVLTRGLEQL